MCQMCHTVYVSCVLCCDFCTASALAIGTFTAETIPCFYVKKTESAQSVFTFEKGKTVFKLPSFKLTSKSNTYIKSLKNFSDKTNVSRGTNKCNTLKHTHWHFNILQDKQYSLARSSELDWGLRDNKTQTQRHTNIIMSCCPLVHTSSMIREHKKSR